MSLQQPFWTIEDFNVFTIEGLQSRMEALQERIQPKFHKLGRSFSDQLSAHGSGEFFPHVAKHARRTVNPPTDSWVAMAPSKRGYKALPHFQIGLWETHIFIIAAVIYENSDKKGIAERLIHHKNQLLALPSTYLISGDHMKAEMYNIQEIGEDGINQLLERLQTIKKAELLIGRQIPKETAVQMTTEEFFQLAEETVNDLLPIYDLIIGKC